MYLYDEVVLDRYSADQLESLIADEIPTMTEAAQNSLVDLQFNLVYTGKASDATMMTGSQLETNYGSFKERGAQKTVDVRYGQRPVELVENGGRVLVTYGLAWTGLFVQLVS